MLKIVISTADKNPRCWNLINDMNEEKEKNQTEAAEESVEEVGAEDKVKEAVAEESESTPASDTEAEQADKGTGKKKDSDELKAKKKDKNNAEQKKEPAKKEVESFAPAISGIEPEKKPIPLKSAPASNGREREYKDDEGSKKPRRNDISVLLKVREEDELPKELSPPAKGKVFYATGRRKTSSARVFMAGGKGTIRVNGSSLEDYFPFPRARELAIQPLIRLKSEQIFDINISVKGGGVEGQAGAIKHGVARALLKYDEDLKRFLRKNGYLTRDPRSVERKKVGLHKARKSPQFSKR